MMYAYAHPMASSRPLSRLSPQSSLDELQIVHLIIRFPSTLLVLLTFLCALNSGPPFVLARSRGGNEVALGLYLASHLDGFGQAPLLDVVLTRRETLERSRHWRNIGRPSDGLFRPVLCGVRGDALLTRVYEGIEGSAFFEV